MKVWVGGNIEKDNCAEINLHGNLYVNIAFESIREICSKSSSLPFIFQKRNNMLSLYILSLNVWYLGTENLEYNLP